MRPTGYSSDTILLRLNKRQVSDKERTRPCLRTKPSRVLVVPTELFRRLGYFQGFNGDVGRYLDELLRPEHTSYRPRAEVEKDPSFKQLIPYMIFRHTDAAGQADRVPIHARHGPRAKAACTASGAWASAGTSRRSTPPATTAGNPYEEGMRRELEEEVVVDTPYTARCVGMINDDQTEVGRVHLGVVHLFDVQRPAVRPRETEIIECGFRPVEDDPGRHGGIRDLVGDLHEGVVWEVVGIVAKLCYNSRSTWTITPPPGSTRGCWRRCCPTSPRPSATRAAPRTRSDRPPRRPSTPRGSRSPPPSARSRKEIVFTSGATESNNLAISGVAERHGRRGKHLVSVVTEHPAVLDPLKKLARRGFEVTLLPVIQAPDERAGLIGVEQVAEALRDDTILVSVMLANNEIGVIQPVAEIGRICRAARRAAAHRRHAGGRQDSRRRGAAPGRPDELHGAQDLRSEGDRRPVRSPRAAVRLEPLIDGGGQERGCGAGR